MGRNLESFIIENYKKAMAEEKELMMGIVERFRSAGYQIWMDDFGSAYSSLNVLKEFSFDELPARAMIGHTVREIFPSLGEDWYMDVKSATLDGKIVEGEFDHPKYDKNYRFTARQIIYPGYCAIACVELPVINKRKYLLIADDVESNRNILGNLLSDEYEIYYACDGIETMDMLRKHKDEISLLILDLYMPNMSGRDVLSCMQNDDELMFVPTIVLTVDQQAELDCLKMGAMDFIPKPYPDMKVVKARISKCIELSEQRDKLTGLFNSNYFLQYVSRYDHYENGTAFDAFVIDVNRFSEITEQQGRDFGNLILRSIGSGIKKLIRKTGGIGCRKEGDTFLFYCPHQTEHEHILKNFLSDVFAQKELNGKVTMRIGVYPNALQEPDIVKRFSYAKIAADSMKDEPDKIFEYYTDDIAGTSGMNTEE